MNEGHAGDRQRRDREQDREEITILPQGLTGSAERQGCQGPAQNGNDETPGQGAGHALTGIQGTAGFRQDTDQMPDERQEPDEREQIL